MNTDQSDVIVVGAGALGASTALHLVKAGVENVILVDKDGPGSGTSKAGAGFVGPLAAGWDAGWGRSELDVEYFSIDFYTDLATRHDIDFRHSGHLYIARDAEAWKHIEKFHDTDTVPDSQLVEPDDIRAVTNGFLDGSLFHRAVFQPSAVQLSAGKAARAIAAEFVTLGGRVESRRSVTGLIKNGSAVTGVETEHGPLFADKVVVAGGSWTNTILGGDYFLPQVPLVLSRMITEPLSVPANFPALNFAGYSDDGSGLLWVREDCGRLNWGMSYPDYPRDDLVDNPIPDRFDDIRLDGIFQVRRASQSLSHLIPGLATDKFWVAHGAPCLTPDRRALIGPIDERPGLYVVGGCNGVGIQHGPGWGKVAAEIVTGTTPFVDARPWNANRFGGLYSTNRDVFLALAARSGPMTHV